MKTYNLDTLEQSIDAYDELEVEFNESNCQIKRLALSILLFQVAKRIKELQPKKQYGKTR